MQISYIFSKNIEEKKLGIVIQALYMAKEFQKELGQDFLFVPQKVSEKKYLKENNISFAENGCFIRRWRMLYYLLWLLYFLARRKRSKKHIIYCVDWYVAIPAIFYKKIFGHKVAMECHDPPPGSWRDYIIARFCDYLLPTTKAMAEYIEGKYSGAKSRVLVSPNAIDIEIFSGAPEKIQSRKTLGLPEDVKVILYSGNIMERKGVYTLAEAISMLNRKDVLTVIVGGTGQRAVDKFKEIVADKSGILLVGYRPHEEIPLWISAADVAVAPHSANTEDVMSAAAQKWMSPLKILEYMAAKRPVITTDIPSIREIADEGNSILIAPDNPKKLKEAIIKALENDENIDKMIERAFLKVKEYTWEKRTGEIINFFKTQ